MYIYIYKYILFYGDICTCIETNPSDLKITARSTGRSLTTGSTPELDGGRGLSLHVGRSLRALRWEWFVMVSGWRNVENHDSPYRSRWIYTVEKGRVQLVMVDDSSDSWQMMNSGDGGWWILDWISRRIPYRCWLHSEVCGDDIGTPWSAMGIDDSGKLIDASYWSVVTIWYHMQVQIISNAGSWHGMRRTIIIWTNGNDQLSSRNVNKACPSLTLTLRAFWQEILQPPMDPGVVAPITPGPGCRAAAPPRIP